MSGGGRLERHLSIFHVGRCWPRYQPLVSTALQELKIVEVMMVSVIFFHCIILIIIETELARLQICLGLIGLELLMPEISIKTEGRYTLHTTGVSL